MRYRFAIILLGWAFWFGGEQVLATDKPVAADGKGEVPSHLAQPTAGNFPVDAQSSISAALGREDDSYQISARAGYTKAENTQNQINMLFKSDGVHIRSGAATLKITFAGYGYGDAVSAARAVAPHASLNRVEYRRGLLTEWYLNGPLGLEQGFTLAAPPERKQGGPLTIALALSGNLKALADSDTDLVLQGHDGQTILRYAGVASYDAMGKPLRTWVEVRDRQVRLRVDDAGAVYPVVVDPWLQKAKLSASDGKWNSLFGSSLSVSRNGNLIVIGACQSEIGKNLGQGAVYVFTKPQNGWSGISQFTAKLTTSDGQAGDSFGQSVAISADGNTIVIGAPNATIKKQAQQGAVYVFTVPATGIWATTNTYTAKLTASDGANYAWLGSSVAFDGISAVAGAYGAAVGSNFYQGAAYVFTEPSGGWTNMTETAKLTASDGQAWDLLGYSVSANNGVAATGAIQAGVAGQASQGAAYVFVEPSGGWVSENEAAKLTASDGQSLDQLGASIVLSPDGTTVVSGAQAANVQGNAGQGAAYVFLEPTGGWSGPMNESAKLTASDGIEDDYFGASVAVNFSANTILAGAPLAPYFNTQQYTGPGPGKSYTYVKPSTGWATTSAYTQELTARTGVNGDEYGMSVGLNANTSAIGACYATVKKNTFQGLSYVNALR
jgi:trimeric autotransporter adhesin